jgi:2-oxo-4-hydroxy-4-carboxy--5-ureidoimidazoline (OHCU) decarboxylase
MDAVHADVAVKAGETAKEEYLKKHPEMAEKAAEKAETRTDKEPEPEKLVDRRGDRDPMGMSSCRHKM